MNKIYPDKKTFIKLATKGNIIPIYKSLIVDLETTISTFIKLTNKHRYSYLLESVEGGEHWGRYSFISWAPKLIFQSKDHRFSIYKPETKPIWKTTNDPLTELKALMQNFKPVEIPGLPRFWGGAVGYISYDMVRFFENLPKKPKDTLNLPDSFFMLTDRIIIFDHLSHIINIVLCVDIDDYSKTLEKYDKAVNDILEIENNLNKSLVIKKNLSPIKHKPVNSNVRKIDFLDSISKSKEYIKNGDIIQVVLSQRFSRHTNADPFDIYRSLRIINPSPYMYFLRLDNFDLIGSSPEILVRKEGDLAETRPIAGTRPRGKDPQEDEKLIENLLKDEKERAEHIMLVDLGRNDLSRVCLEKSVKVTDLMSVEKYSHVMHIVSSIEGKLKPDITSFELFRACFPAGTVSGAPKIRAMEIIDELESSSRGPYAGAVGYFSYSGNMDMAITIRTIVMKDNIAYAQAGAGIVADSIPELEYLETKNKAKALFAAIDMAENRI